MTEFDSWVDISGANGLGTLFQQVWLQITIMYARLIPSHAR